MPGGGPAAAAAVHPPGRNVMAKACGNAADRRTIELTAWPGPGAQARIKQTGAPAKMPAK